jgi:HSP20 family molecular chaperone IbpA
MRTTISRFEPFRTSLLQEQLGRLFNEAFECSAEESSITTWAPAVDIYETEHELVVKADLPDIKSEELDIRVENNILTIRGERKFEKKVNGEQLPARGACVWRVQPEFLAGQHREQRGNQGRVQKRGADADDTQAGGSQAEADQGERGYPGGGGSGRTVIAKVSPRRFAL